MLRSAAFASFLGVFVLASQPAGAEDFFLFTRHPKVDPRVATAGLGVGAASTAAYFIAKEGHGLDWTAWTGATFGCMALAPMVAAAFVPERELTTREVMVMEGSCLLPIVGGILVNALFDANPQWEAQPRPVRVSRAVRR